MSADAPVETASAWKPKANPWLIAFVVSLAAFMEVLDTSIANVALPHIAGNLGASSDESTWVLTSYLVSNAIILPITRLAGFAVWTEALFSHLSYAVHRRVPCCAASHPRLAILLAVARDSRRRRRWIATDGASDSSGHISS